MAARPFPILFITASRLGDAILSSGLVKFISDHTPEPRFTIVGSALAAPLFSEVPGLEALIVMEKKPFGRHWLDLWLRVRRRRWGLVVDLRGSAISGLLERSRRAVYKAAHEATHKVVEAARLLKIEDAPPPPFLFTNPDIEARADELTAGPRPVLAMAPAAKWLGKTWPAERFALAARRLLGPGGVLAGGRLMILGGPDDHAAAAPLKAAVSGSRRIDLVDRENLLVCYAALKRADLFIGNDSGLTHLAAAAGAPTLAVFGPSDERRYAPWGDKGWAVRGPRAFDEFRQADPTLSQEVCHMMDLPVETVVAGAESVIAHLNSDSLRA